LKENEIEFNGDNKGLILNSDGFIFGDLNGNTSVKKVDGTNLVKLSSAITDPVNSTVDNNNTVLVYNGVDQKIKRTNALWFANTAATVGSKLSYTGLNSVSLLYNSDLMAHYLSIANKTSFLANISKFDSVTVGSCLSTDSSVVDGSKDYSKLMLGTLAFKNATSTVTMNRDDIIATNNLKSLVSKTPDGNSKMVIYDNSSKVYNFADIPASSNTVVKKKLVLTSLNTLTMVDDTLLTTIGSTALKTIEMNDNDELIIDGGNGDYIPYNRWYAVRLTSSTTVNYLAEVSILNHVNNGYTSPNSSYTKGSERCNIADVMWCKLPAAITTSVSIPKDTLLFKMINSNGTYSTGEYFRGFLKIKMITKDINNVSAAVVT
jgi:hypothetical protein